MVELQLLLALVNSILGFALVGVSLCRINSMGRDTPTVAVAPYAALVGVGVWLALMPLKNNWPEPEHVWVTLTLLLIALVGHVDCRDQ